MISCADVLTKRLLIRDTVYQQISSTIFNFFSIPYQDFGQILESFPFYWIIFKVEVGLKTIGSIYNE